MDDKDKIPFPDKMLATPEPEPMSAADRLRAFEDEHNHPRIGDRIERGLGSLFQADVEGGWGEKHRAHHAALEALVAAEKEDQAASQAEDAAHAKLEAAINRAAETEKDL